jgi:hypothetical protein
MKYKTFLFFVLIFLSFTSNSGSKNDLKSWSIKECLNVSFRLGLSSDGSMLSMLERKLNIEKRKCVINIKYKKILESNFEVDVCRSPVHIKKKESTVEVLKKDKVCDENNKELSLKERIENYFNKNNSGFCDTYKEIKKIIQNDGLIFAKGEKENITSDHGKITCVYRILNGYLRGNRVYTRYSDFQESSIPLNDQIKNNKKPLKNDIKNKAI